MVTATTIDVETGRGDDWLGWGWKGRRLTCSIRRDVGAALDADPNRGVVAVWAHTDDEGAEDGELVAGGIVHGLTLPGFESAAAVSILIDVAARAGWPSEVIEVAADDTGAALA